MTPTDPPDVGSILSLTPAGTLVFGGMAVGQALDGVLVVNLGWARLAGLGVRIEGDPACDRKRGGIVLERPAP